MTGGTRSRSGCLACRRRKKRCDEAKPICDRCQGSGATCVYPNTHGTFHTRFLVSSALEHYTLPTRSFERHFVNLLQQDVARLCLTYATPGDGSSDLASVIQFDPWREIPRSMSNAVVNVSEMGYIEYCESSLKHEQLCKLTVSEDSEVISASRVYVTGDDNQFRSLTLPYACANRGPVLFMIMALSAAEMASAQLGNAPRLLSSAASYYDNAIIQLQQSLDDADHAEENLMACVLMSTFEVMNDIRPAWLQHLNGAVAIYNRFEAAIGRESALFALQYFSFRWILLETTMPPGTYPLEEVMGDFSMTARLLKSLNTMLQQTIDARPSAAMQKIDNNLGCSLEFLQLVNRISALSALRFHGIMDEPGANEMSDLYSTTTSAFDQVLSDMTLVARISDSYLEHSSQCFKLAGRVFLRLVCLDTSIAQMSLTDVQVDLLHSLRQVINEDQQRRAFPMWPLFIAGCASFDDEHRQLVLDMYRTLERKWPIGNISLVQRVTTQIWQSRDLNERDCNRQHDWQKLITTFGWKLALS